MIDSFLNFQKFHTSEQQQACLEADANLVTIFTRTDTLRYADHRRRPDFMNRLNFMPSNK